MSAAMAISVRAFHSPGVSPTLSPADGIERTLSTAFPPLLDPPPPHTEQRSFPRLDPSPLLPERRHGGLHGRPPMRQRSVGSDVAERSHGATFVERNGSSHAERIDVLSMSMTPKPIRFSTWAWEVIGREAAANGLSTAEFVRAAALASAVLSARRRGAGDTLELEALMLRAINDRDDS